MHFKLPKGGEWILCS